MTGLEQGTENLRQRAAAGVFWSGLHSGGTQIFSLAVFLVLARLLEPSDFGLIALAGVFLAFVQVFLDQGFADAIVQRDSVEREHLDSAFWATIVVALVLVAVSLSTAGVVAGAFGEPQLAPIIRVLSATFVLGALASVQQAILRRNLRQKSLAARSLAAAAVGGATGVTMAFLRSLAGERVAPGLPGVAPSSSRAVVVRDQRRRDELPQLLQPEVGRPPHRLLPRSCRPRVLLGRLPRPAIAQSTRDDDQRRGRLPDVLPAPGTT
jgi:hypothetical protein